MRRAYAVGVLTVGVAAAAAVALRAFAEAAFLGAFGAARLPWFFLAAALSFGGATLLYDVASRRLRPLLLDAALLGLLAAACALAPTAHVRGGGTLFAWTLLLIGLSQVAALAGWNALAATVSGREARRLLPRAGAAVTAGGTLAGFGAGAVVATLGLSRLPVLVVPLTAIMLVGCIALSRLSAGPGVAAPVDPKGRERGRDPALAGDPRALVRWLALAALLEAAAATLVELRFNVTLQRHYPGDRLGVAISVFYGVTNAALLLLQLLAVPRILVTKSVPFTASLHPLVLVVAVGAALASPGLIAVAAARTVDGILRGATSRTSQEVSLSVLPPGSRERWKVLLRGLFTPLGTALTGVALLAFGRAVVAGPVLAGVPLLALLWLVVVRRAARAFLASLTAPLGMREVALREARRKTLRRDEIVALIERAGDPDPRAAGLARALLDRLGLNADELSPHLDHDDPAVRAALFAMAAARPHPHAAGDVRAAVAVERDPEALAAGLRALAAHGDASAAARAAELARLSRAFEPVARAYRAEVGLGDAAEIRHALEEQLAADPAWAARLAIAALERAAVSEVELAALLEAAPPASRFLLGAAVGVAPEGWLEALAAEDPAARAAARSLSPRGAGRLLGLHAGGAAPAEGWTQLARAAHTAEARPVLLALLADPRPAIRHQAARALARLCRDGLATVARAEVASALERELDELASRPPGVEHDAALGRALAIAALQSDPAALRAAERRLRSPLEAERRRALDVLQELSRSQPRLLDSVERYLTSRSARATQTSASTK